MSWFKTLKKSEKKTSGVKYNENVFVPKSQKVHNKKGKIQYIVEAFEENAKSSKSFPVDCSPQFLTYLKGKILITSQTDTIKVYDPSGTHLESIHAEHKDSILSGLALNSTENSLFLCDARSQSQARVQIFNIKEDIQPVAHIGQGLFQAPHGICVTKSNKTLVTDVERREIFIIEDDGYHASVFGGIGQRPGQFMFPHDVVFDEVHKRIIVSDTLNHRLQVFSESGRFMDIVEYDKNGKRLFSCPTSLKFDNDNHLVVCDNGANSLKILNQDMQLIKQIPLGNTQKPSAVTILPLGKLCVACAVQSTLLII
ncbi:E3 ubiquitin-protein ligase TRIM71 isoform X1 [Hydra vulgaris]|uniref:E3 ubiquitin-protein ligase TRIM71 isoform X1 n=1 Tax=Hydra vulgaris TaxID=6087 RepID=UPI0001923962|nr:E3 ubiquitin-protein ligase TRIM71 [Hydra vulgaris]